MTSTCSLFWPADFMRRPCLSWQGTGAPVEVLRNLRQRDLVNTDDIVLVVGVNTGDERAYLNIFQTFRISALDQVPGAPPFQDGWLATA
jgi:hypothetical protein